MKKFIIVFLIVFVFVCFIAFSFTGSVILSFLTFFPYFSNNIADSGIVTPWISKIIAIILTFMVIGGSYNFFKFDKFKRRKGVLILILCFFIFYILIHLNINKNIERIFPIQEKIKILTG